MIASRRLGCWERMNSVVPEWEPNPWDAKALEAERQQAGYDRRTDWPIVWRPTPWSDLPDLLFGQPREWFSRNDITFCAEHGGEDLVLSEPTWSGWPDPPRYGLASRQTGRTDLAWLSWGYFDELPAAWIFSNQDKGSVG